MPQISLDIQEAMADRLLTAATQRNDSVPGFIVSVLTERLNEDDETERGKNHALELTQGTFRDEPLAEPPEISLGADAPRRFDLLWPTASTPTPASTTRTTQHPK
jgi:hypothetical protein